MATTLCGVCHTEPKKYKCPTCSMPYCSISCFRAHKSTHPESPSTPSAAVHPPEIPQPPPPEPPPKYLRTKTDFSLLATNPKFRDLLKSQPKLLSVLQRVYAVTIEPEQDDASRSQRRGGFGGRRRGFRGRGRGGRGGWMENGESRWTPKKGDADAMRLLKGLREGKRGEEEKEVMAAFVGLVDEIFAENEAQDGVADNGNGAQGS